MANTSFYGLTGTTATVQNTIQTSVNAAATSAANAATSETNAATHASTAETHKDAAAVSAAAALASQNTAATQAALATTNGAAQVTLATTQANLATTNGAAQVTLATAQVALATTQATNSASSATASASSAADALSHKNDAETAKTASETAKTASETAKTASEAAQTASETAKAGAETALDDFTDIYLGAKNTSSGNPTVDNDGDALQTGALMYDSTNSLMKTYNGSAWVAAFASSGGALINSNNLSDVSSASSSRGNLGLGTAAVLNTGTSAGNAIVLDGSARLPAVDGSQLTGLPAGYTGWQISDGSNLENIASTNTVTFAGSGAASVAYNTSNNTLTVTGTDTTYSAATTGAAGLMSAADKTKLDGIEAAADVTDSTNVVAALTAGTGITISGSGTIATTVTATTSASDLSSGTLPDARFPSVLPAISGANLTNLPAAGIGNVVEDTSPQLGANLQSNGFDIQMADGDELRLGASDDLRIYHTTSGGGQNLIQTGSSGELYIKAGSVDIIANGSNSTAIQMPTDGSVNLFYGGGTKFQTQSGGARVIGDFTATGNVTAYSDQRLKDNIQTIGGALSKVRSMRGVTFTKDGEKSSGVIAQEMEQVAPELVMDGEFKSVAYGNLVGYLIEAVKELSDKVKELENR